MINHQADFAAMGPAFARWERLTEEYQKGFEALRRGDAGASVHMARLAEELQRINSRLSGSPHAGGQNDDRPAESFSAGRSAEWR